MKILLTGKPGVGKSTILDKVRHDFKGEKFGIISQELRDKEGHRLGFEAVNSQGDRKMFASIDQIKSNYIVGGKYHVDLSVIDKFVVPAIAAGINMPEGLVFIDEIGRMQAFSQKFLETINNVLNSDTNILATIVYDPEPWSIQFKTNHQVILVQVSQLNRDILPKLLHAIYDSSIYLLQLNRKQQKQILTTTRVYFDEQKYTQIGKLFRNAIPYLIQGKVEQITNKFIIRGNTNMHAVLLKNNQYLCDCDLFNGRGKYRGYSGECSHIQAVKLSQIN